MKKRQQGMTTVEAAIGAALMLILLFGAIEVARVIFVYNFLDEVTRRGARVAAVCPFNHPAIRKAAIFAEPKGNDTSSPIVGQLTTSDVNIDYLDAAGNDVHTTAPNNEFAKTKFVRAYVNSFPLKLLFFPNDIYTPQFRTILPSESLGFNPELDECRCFEEPGDNGCGWYE